MNETTIGTLRLRGPGARNSLTDVAGLAVGQAQDGRLKSGVSVVLCEQPAIAAVHVMGGAPGTRETDLLEPHNTVERVDAIVLAGGSAFGLDAASGVQAWLRQQGRGFAVGPHRVPIVPAAILFDLMNGGDKDWGTYPPYRELGYQAAQAAGREVALGSNGAGTGALTAGLKGGLGTASVVLENGTTVAALVAVNAIGSTVFGPAGHFWAAPFEFGAEFGGRGMGAYLASQARSVPAKHRRAGIGDDAIAGTNTTIAVITTDASLTKAEAKRLAVAAHDGFARAIWPAHTPMDGDLVFALSTGTGERRVTTDEFIDLCAAASSTMARAIARGVYEASPADGDVMDTWQAMHGSL